MYLYGLVLFVKRKIMVTSCDIPMEDNTKGEKTLRGGWRSAIFIIYTTLLITWMILSALSRNPHGFVLGTFIPKGLIQIMFVVEVAERFAYYGVAGNLFMYLTTELGMATAVAAKNVNIWRGVSAIFPVIGGFLADSYIGRFKTIIISTVIYLTGLILLTITVSVVPPNFRSLAFFIALYTLSVGEGGHKPCVQTFAADQFDENTPHEKAAKASFFNWWYVGIVCGATTAVLVVIYVEDHVSWTWGFGMTAVFVAAALVVFLVGSLGYRRQAPVGSPFTGLAQVVVAAVRKRRLLAVKGIRRFEDCERNDGVKMEGGVGALARTNKFRFLDKATIIDSQDQSTEEKRNPWRLCSTTQVEECKMVLQLIPIWLTCLMFAVVSAQLGTYFTKQGTTLRRHITPSFQIPPASFQVITGITILISILLYERLLIPVARSITKHPAGITTLQRIGTGLFFSILTMVTAALVETRRLSVARENGLLDRPRVELPMSAWWLVPQYVLCGLADVFAIVGLQELFYEEMPAGMRSIGAAAYLMVTGMGSLLSGGVIAVVQWISMRFGHGWLGDNLNRSKLENFYWVLAAMSGVNWCAYVWFAGKFRYK